MARARRLFVVDWGSTNLRAHVVDADGTVLASFERSQGVMQIEQQQIPCIFRHLLLEAQLDYDTMPTVLVGMIGSGLGWYEVPMCKGPASLETVAAALQTNDDLRQCNAVIVPGITAPSCIGHPDMMRGEETQVFGTLLAFGTTEATVCLPGTHSKWVQCSGGQITNITTAITGEVFEFFRQRGVLRDNTVAQCTTVQMDAFREGLSCAAMGLGALQTAFSTRARNLNDPDFGKVAATSFLSGIMIGSEVEAMAKTCQGPVFLVGAPALSKLYAAACEAFSKEYDTLDSSIAVTLGACALYRASGLTS